MSPLGRHIMRLKRVRAKAAQLGERKAVWSLTLAINAVVRREAPRAS